MVMVLATVWTLKRKFASYENVLPEAATPVVADKELEAESGVGLLVIRFLPSILISWNIFVSGS